MELKGEVLFFAAKILFKIIYLPELDGKENCIKISFFTTDSLGYPLV